MSRKSVSQFVHDVAVSALRNASTSCVMCEFSLCDDCWPSEVNESLLGDAIHKLVISAWKAMPEARIIRLCVESIISHAEVSQSLSERKYLKIYVEDHDMAMVLAY